MNVNVCYAVKSFLSTSNTLYNPFKVGFKRVPSYSNVIHPDDTK